MSNEWISVKIALPQDGERVLGYFPSKFLPDEYCVEILYYKKSRRGFFYYDSEYGETENEIVTHWMPIPKAPHAIKKEK